jgi:hypothetical protein
MEPPQGKALTTLRERAQEALASGSQLRLFLTEDQDHICYPMICCCVLDEVYGHLYLPGVDSKADAKTDAAASDATSDVLRPPTDLRKLTIAILRHRFGDELRKAAMPAYQKYLVDCWEDERGKYPDITIEKYRKPAPMTIVLTIEDYLLQPNAYPKVPRKDS